MDIKEQLSAAIRQAAQKAIADGVFPAGELADILLEVPPDKKFGDFATNFAMQSARVFRMNPKKIAEELVSRIEGDWLDHAEIAGPGFINFYLKGNVLYDLLRHLYEGGEACFNLPQKDTARIMVEYVSANPTGLLHVGHGRGAAVGSALVNLLRAAGYPVHSEYYINDAGNQIDNLAASVNARYLELLGKETVFPENGYHGADIVDTAKRIVEADGEKYLSLSEEQRLAVFKEFALKEKLAQLKEDLAAFNVTFDEWFSERTLHPEAVRDACQTLKEKGKVYDKDGALWLRSTDYGDDKDRVVIRDNGVPTYLAADIAYHQNKLERGFGHLINIWGADHHGYVCRVKAAMEALRASGVRRLVMLTGDGHKAAEEIAAALSFDLVRSELLPKDKVASVEHLLADAKKGERVAFVGDGINDAPVLARADVGIAMGAMGSDAAIEAADVVLMDDDLRKLAKAVRIARRCMGIVRTNIAASIGIKVICLVLGAFGLADLWLAIFADTGVLVLATLNAVRVLFVKEFRSFIKSS